MIKIIVECIFIVAFILLLLRVQLFSKRWKNVCLFVVFSVLITALVSAIFRRYLGFEYSLYVLLPCIVFFFISLYRYSLEKPISTPKSGEDVFVLGSKYGKIEFYYPRDNFLVYGGAGSGKTASVGKPLLEQYIKNHWAGFIYDYKDFDYTKTAYNLINKYDYPYSLYRVSFTDMSRTHRFNPLKKKIIGSETFFFQAMDDFLKASAPADVVKNDSGGWFNGALGLLKGVGIRFFNFKGEYEKYCTLPHILNFILLATPEQLLAFLEGDMMAKANAGAFVGAGSSERTRDSYRSTLNNYITNLATNKNVCYVLSGDDFDFYLNDPEEPKLFAVSNNFALESLISPIIAMLVPMSTRKIEFGNTVKFAYILDEMTTFRVNDFQGMPSVLREYGASFLIMTQSSSKIESTYGKNDRRSIESNCANLFLGRTKDPDALKYYPMFFGKEEKDKESFSTGSSSGKYNSSVTRSKQKEDVYDSNTFAELKQGEFILSAGQSNVTRLKTRFEMFKLDEKPLPIVNLTTEKEVSQNYEQIWQDVEKILVDLCGK